MIERCEVTGKRCFDSRAQARQAMRKLSARLRAYTCEHCGKWHFTKQMDKRYGRYGKRRIE